MPRAWARSAYGTSRRIGEAGISVARLESLTLLNATPITFALRVQLLVRQVVGHFESTGVSPVNHTQDARATTKLAHYRAAPPCTDSSFRWSPDKHRATRIRVLFGKTAHRIYQSFPFAQALKQRR